MRSSAPFIAQLCPSVGVGARGRALNPWHLVHSSERGFDCFNRKSLGVLQLRSEPLRRTPLAHQMPR